MSSNYVKGLEEEVERLRYYFRLYNKEHDLRKNLQENNGKLKQQLKRLHKELEEQKQSNSVIKRLDKVLKQLE